MVKLTSTSDNLAPIYALLWVWFEGGGMFRGNYLQDAKASQKFADILIYNSKQNQQVTHFQEQKG